MLQKKVLEKIKTRILCSITFFSEKTCLLWDNVEWYGRAIHVTDGNIMRHVRFECWIPKATDTHSEYVIFIVFPRRQLWSYTPLSVLYNLIELRITHAIDRELLNNLTISMSYLLSYRGFVKLLFIRRKAYVYLKWWQADTIGQNGWSILWPRPVCGLDNLRFNYQKVDHNCLMMIMLLYEYTHC